MTKGFVLFIYFLFNLTMRYGGFVIWYNFKWKMKALKH